RAALWLVLSLPYVAAIVWSKAAMLDTSAALADVRFLIELAATFATAVTAAAAAFYSVVPGFDRRVMLLPVIALTLWLPSVGRGCLGDWLALRAVAFLIPPRRDRL